MYDLPPCKEMLDGAVRDCVGKHLGRPPSGVKVLPDCPLCMLMPHNFATSDAAAAAKIKCIISSTAHNRGGQQGGVTFKASEDLVATAGAWRANTWRAAVGSAGRLQLQQAEHQQLQRPQLQAMGWRWAQHHPA